MLTEVINILKYSSSVLEMEPYFEAYPVCRELPYLFNFLYNLKRKNYAKLN